MRIRFVTPSAGLKRNLLFKVAAEVTGNATHRGVFSEKWVFRFRVIKFEIGCNFLPTRRGVAMLAGFFELTAMGIEMTRRTGRKFHVLEARRPAWGIGLVAFFTGDRDVQTGQRITRLRVIEFLSRLPIGGVMATLAILAQLSFVIVHVARNTFLRQPQVGLAEIFILNQSTFGRRDVCQGVTFLAIHLGVLAIERISSEFVVKLLDWNVPVNQVKINSIVFEMAVHAIFALRILHLQPSVITMFF